MAGGPRILIVEARVYDDITDSLVRGAVQTLTAEGAGFKRVLVPGLLETLPVIRYAIRAMELRATDNRFAGYVVLGCAINGDLDGSENLYRVCLQGMKDLALQYSLAIGNGLIHCTTQSQAMDFADPDSGNAGGRAAQACLRMMQVKRELGL